MDQIIIDDFKDINDLDSNSYILFMYDSFGNIRNMENINQFENHIDIMKLEEEIKNKINKYKFKTLQNRNYLPISTSLLINYKNYNILYVPIMWIKQDISNTRNYYNSLMTVLIHIYKIKLLSKNDQVQKLYLTNFDYNIVQKTIEDFKKIDNIYDTLDYKDDIFINPGYYNLDEQPPIYQNNEFRELTNY